MGVVKDPLKNLRAVTVKAAAEALAVSRRTLERWIAAGEFPKPIKIGATARIRVVDLERFIESHRSGD